MYSELTNLLPKENVRALRREYFVRLATIVVLMLAGVIVVQGVLLLPSYIYENQITNSRTAELKRLSATTATTQEQSEQAELAALQTESTHLLTLHTSSSASSLLRAVLAVPHTGISINAFVFTLPQDGTARNLQISGVADAREDLRAYDTALSALPFVTSADLPISDYAKDTNIPFTITLTGSLLP